MVVVLGGGIGGLSAAYYAARQLPGRTVRLVEAGSRLGGWMRSTRLSDGLVFEHGPRTIRPVGENGASTLNLIEQLGIADKVEPIMRSHPAAKTRYIYARGALHPLPSSLGALLRTQPPFSKPLAAALLQDLRAPVRRSDDENCYDFVARRLGSDIAEFAVAPLLCGVCAGDARQISVKMLFRALFEAEQNHGAIWKGIVHNMMSSVTNPKPKNVVFGTLAKRSRTEKWSIYSLKNGIETLPETLEKAVSDSGVEICKNDACVGLKFLDSGCAEVRLASGRTIRAGSVISALPAPQLAAILPSEYSSIIEYLRAIPYATVAVVNLRYKGPVLKNPAFGFLVPPSQNLPLLGVIFDSVCFPHVSGDTVLTAMMGGHWFHPQFSSASPRELAGVATEWVGRILGVSGAPCHHQVTVQRDCIPQYTVGHYERLGALLREIQSRHWPLHLVGSAYNGIGLNDVIASARVAVERLAD